MTTGAVEEWPLKPGQSVYSHDEQRIGRIERVACSAFKVSATPDHPACWLRRDAVHSVTAGGVVYLGSLLSELQDSRWVPPPNLRGLEGGSAEQQVP